MFIKLYLIALPVFIVLDLLWLGVVAKGWYSHYLGHLMRPSPNWPPAILFYLLFTAAIVVFAVMPALEKSSLRHVLLYGCFFGFTAYMTYELTNYALIKDWPWQIVIIDIVWGIFLAGAVAAATFWLGGKFVS